VQTNYVALTLDQPRARLDPSGAQFAGHCEGADLILGTEWGLGLRLEITQTGVKLVALRDGKRIDEIEWSSEDAGF
jgi:hypothetical protein